jgi:hypothetical protein
MNLRSVHAVLIALSAALAVMFGFWCLSQYDQGAGTAALVASIVSFTASLGLIIYDSWFLRRTRALR